MIYYYIGGANYKAIRKRKILFKKNKKCPTKNFQPNLASIFW